MRLKSQNRIIFYLWGIDMEQVTTTLQVCIIRENFQTILKAFDDIRVNDDFLYLQKIARQEHCLLIATIDSKGSTIINQLQLEVFENEIKKMQSRHDVNQKILDRLQEVTAVVSGCEYIRFMSK